MSLRRKALGGLTAAALALVALQVLNLVSVGAEAAPPADLTGPELAEALGLEPVDWPVVGCNQLTEVSDGVGYCLDSVLPDPADNVQASLLMMRLQGRVPTATDEAFYALIEELRIVDDKDDPESVARRDAIIAELAAYWAANQ